MIKSFAPHPESRDVRLRFSNANESYDYPGSRLASETVCVRNGFGILPWHSTGPLTSAGIEGRLSQPQRRSPTIRKTADNGHRFWLPIELDRHVKPKQSSVAVMK